jgi:hypothetical protein
MHCISKLTRSAHRTNALKLHGVDKCQRFPTFTWRAVLLDNNVKFFFSQRPCAPNVVMPNSRLAGIREVLQQSKPSYHTPVPFQRHVSLPLDCTRMACTDSLSAHSLTIWALLKAFQELKRFSSHPHSSSIPTPRFCYTGMNPWNPTPQVSAKNKQGFHSHK